MILLLKYELIKTLRKLRTYIGFGLIAALIPLVFWGLSYAGENMVNGLTRGLQQNFLFSGTLFNGWFVAEMVMNALFVHIPFLILLVSGDMFAGEATSGTYRLLLTRPPSRHRIFIAKVTGSALYTAAIVFFLGTLSVGLGLLLFGGGELLVTGEDGMAILAATDVWWRFVLAYALAAWGMGVVASLGLLFSTFVENAIGPIVGSFAVVVLMLIIGTMPLEFFENIRPYLFTSYFDVWRRAFSSPLDIGAILADTAVLGIFFCVFTFAAWAIFTRKDILS